MWQNLEEFDKTQYCRWTHNLCMPLRAEATHYAAVSPHEKAPKRKSEADFIP